MKRIIIIIAVSLSSLSCGSNVSSVPQCIIEGNLSGLEGDGWIYMVDEWDDSIVIDSTSYQDGVFRFEVDAA